MIATAATATAIATVAKPFVEPFMKEIVTSKLQEFTKWCKKKGKEIATPKSEHFKAYLERMYDKCNVVKTMAFSNSQLRLKDIYIPLYLKNDTWMLRIKTPPTVIDGVPVELIKTYKKILIKDTAGMGKSTVLKRIFIAIIDNVDENIGIPIYIELNRLNKDHLIVDEIKKELKALFETNDNELLPELIQSGGFVFFFDGYDEIASDKALVTNDIHDFISKAGPNNYFFLTSRPDVSVYSFADFQSFTIEPLKRNEAFELLRKYDLSENKVVSESLIAELNTGKYSSIEEYLGNPLLVSLLFTAYYYRQTVPLKKCQFYRQVYDALFEAHKLAQGVKPHQKHCLLDIDDFNRVLRFVGYECLIQNSVYFSVDTILNSIERAKAFYGNLEFGSSAFLKDLWTTVPLFIKEGTEYSWAHKSLMEYFAAQFIAVDAKEKQDLILSGIIKSTDTSKYGNMLDIYYDIDYKGFSKNVTLPLCESYVEFYDSNQIEAPMIDQESIDLRKSLLFLGSFQIVYGESDSLFPGNLSLLFKSKRFQINFYHSNWLTFCHYLFETKGKSSFFVKEAVLRKMQNSFVDEVHFTLSMCGCDLKKDINILRDFVIFDEYNKRYVLDVNDGQIELGETVGIPRFFSKGIVLRTGVEHPFLYHIFNMSMLQADPYFRLQLLDYNACKREIADIKNVLSKSENESIMLPG